MKEPKRQALRRIWDTVVEEFDDDKSTAFLLEVSAERARIEGYKDCDCSDVAEAICDEPTTNSK